MTTDIPNFSFSDEEIANIKASLGVTDVDESQDPVIIEPPTPKRRGRPPGSKNKATLEAESAKPKLTSEITLNPAPLTKREEREVETRLVNILTGATGMAGMVKPYLPMTDDEARAIAAPLSSYLIRNESTNGVAREILENYDILAMVLGVGAYGMRVYSDRKVEIASNRPANTEATQRISDRKAPDNGRKPDERDSSFVSVPNASRSGNSPFDI